MKLMRAEATMVVYVVVGEGEDEEDVGRQAIVDEISDLGLDDTPLMTEVTPSMHIPREWLEAIPRGAGEDRTVKAWIQGMESSSKGGL